MVPEKPPRDPGDAAVGDGASDDGEPTDEDWLSDPDATAESLKKGAASLDDYTRRRFSRTIVMGIFLVPLGCAFVVAFAIAIAIVSGILALIGLTESRIAGLIGLAVAFLIAVAAVVAVFRTLILRFPRLRRWLNR